jgi:hypothetical protein
MIPHAFQRRFPPPWTIDETDACFIVRDRNGQAPAYVYFEDEPGRGGQRVEAVSGAGMVRRELTKM